MTVKNAIDWHSSIADEFDSKYDVKSQFMERSQVWERYIKKYSNANGSVVDIGCGSGVFSFFASGLNKTVTSLDGSVEMIELCKKKQVEMATDNIDFAISEFHSMTSHAGSSNDLLICSSVIEYVDDLPAAVATLKSMVKPRGVILLSMPNASSIYRKLEALVFRIYGKPTYYAFVRHVVTLKDMQELLVANGLEPLEHSYFSKAPVLSRMLCRLGLRKYGDNLFILAARCK